MIVKKLYLLFIFISSVLFSQEYISVDKTDNNREHIKLVNMNINELKNSIFNSSKNIKVIYFFNNYCSQSLKFTPYLNEIYLKNKDKFDLFVISRKKPKKIEQLYNYLFYEGYYFPVFNVSKESFKSIANVLCSDCNQKIMGYSDFFILDNNNILLSQSNYDLSTTEKIKVLKNYLN